MSHFAQINSDGIVVRIIVAKQDFIDSGAVGDPQFWIETDLDTRGGIHFDPKTKAPSDDQSKALRANGAVIGAYYDSQRDVFVLPRPNDIIFVLDESRTVWVPINVSVNS